ncbi:MAG TPA: NADH-quinone oxidoreductase subunit NuoK, partial [Ginsengibacter sp.]|nr:NADH-quinone oxidoreductase subunit NuoK [Ginsengibacter sp.]
KQDFGYFLNRACLRYAGDRDLCQTLIMLTHYYVALAFLLFSIGVMGVLTRRNALVVLLCIELMMSAGILLLVVYSKMHLTHANSFSGAQASQGQIFALFAIVAAAVIGVTGIAVIFAFFRKTRSVDINFLNRLKN